MKKIFFLFVTVMLAMCLSSLCYAKEFSDVSTNHWAHNYINELSDSGVINGYADGSFKPNGTITNGEFIKLIISSCISSNTDITLAKGTLKSWAKDYIKIAETYDVIDKDEITDANVNEPITRIEMVKIIANADIKMLKNNLEFSHIEFTDITNTNDVYLEHCVGAGLISGYEDNTFKPNNTMTRAEAATIIYRFKNKNKDVNLIDKLVFENVVNGKSTLFFESPINSSVIFNNSNSKYKKEDIYIINIKGDGQRVNNSVEEWDASFNNDGSVMAYISPSNKYTKKYELTLVGDGKIYALNCDSLFAHYINCKEINGLNILDTSNVADMSNMFYECGAITLDLSSFDTSNVTDMSFMFYKCKANKLDLNNFNTSNVKNMNGMFYLCEATSIDLSSFDTSNVTDMVSMFMGCNSLNLDLSSFNTANVTRMSFMFMLCQSKNLDLSNFDTSKITDMQCMFNGCQATSIDLSSFDTSNVTDMSSMFAVCQAKNIDLSNFDTSNVTDMNNMFAGCQATNLNLNNFDTSNVEYMRGMFGGCQVKSLDLSSFDTNNVKDMAEIFSDCPVHISYLGDDYNYVLKCEIKNGYARTKYDADRFNKEYGRNIFIVKQ